MDVDWGAWAQRWDRFQECYVPQREAQLSLMLDYVEQCCGAGPLRILDLCSGPGTIAGRVLRRRPDADVVAVDGDAWLLELGRRTVGGAMWVEADLREEGWSAAIPSAGFQAALSMTALHWLDYRTLARVYADVGRLLEPDGLLLNADLIPAGGHRSIVGAIGRERYFRWQAARVRAGVHWDTFWTEARREPDFGALLAERDRRLGRRPGVVALSALAHREALEAAGFHDVAEIWRTDASAVLMAVRCSPPANAEHCEPTNRVQHADEHEPEVRSLQPRPDPTHHSARLAHVRDPQNARCIRTGSAANTIDRQLAKSDIQLGIE